MDLHDKKQKYTAGDFCDILPYLAFVGLGFVHMGLQSNGIVFEQEQK
jgi:hypothetical protein